MFSGFEAKNILPLNEVELAVINVLRHDARLPMQTVAKIVGISPSYASRIWENLQETGRSWAICQPNLEYPHTCFAFVDVVCQANAHQEVLTQLVAHKDVMNVEVLTQGRDFVATAVTQSVADLEENLIRQMHSWRGISQLNIRLITHSHRDKNQIFRTYWNAQQCVRAERLLNDHPGFIPKQVEKYTSFNATEQNAFQLLAQNPRISAAQIAKELDISASSAQRTLNAILQRRTHRFTVATAGAATPTPLSVQWMARINSARLNKAIESLRNLPKLSMLVSITGRANLLIGADISTPGEIPNFEKQILELLPDLYLFESLVSLRPAKRWGWPTDAFGRRSGDLVT